MALAAARHLFAHMSTKNFSLTNKTRGAVPRVPFLALKNAVLGEEYELSLALLTAAEATRVTQEVKHKDKASNVLSFPLSETSGEILLCPATARRECKEFSMTPRIFIAYLFIHGLLHLRGLDHGDTMEREERRILKQFALRA